MNNILLAFKSLYSYFVANFSFRNVFKISNFFKLAFIYIFALSWLIIFEFEFSENFWIKLISGNLSNYRMSVYTSWHIGESLLSHKIRKVASTMGVDYSAIVFNQAFTEFWLTRGLYYNATNLINYLFKPNFNLAVTHHVNIVPIGYNITYLNVPSTMLYNIKGGFKSDLQHLKKYDAYADLYSFVHGKNPYLDEAIKIDSLQNKKIIPLYLGHNYINYSQPVSFQQALITGTLWGCNRGSLRVIRALKRLAIEDLLIAYGVGGYFKELGNGYKGSFDKLKGTIVDNIITVQKQYGIALIIHSLEHMVEGLPTSRISEALASGSLIISDKHNFVKKFLGDNALYIDTFVSDEQIYQQIKSHILWARNNQGEVRKMTEAAYKVFAEELTIEKQIKFLIEQLNS